jgi:putative transposase
MNRTITFTPGEYYHIYNRGVNKDNIFFSNDDWKYFQRLLYLRNDAEGHVRPNRSHKLALADIPVTKPLVDIQAYALMPNHFHLLLSEREAGGITTFMKRLSTSYSMYINNKYDRSGPLMCRPFRAKHVNSDEYMRWVISYVHLNPVEYLQADWEEVGVGEIHGIQKHLAEYAYCSYRDYYGPERDESVILNKSSLPLFISDLEDSENMLATYQIKTV